MCSSNESYARAINRTERAGTSASSVSGYTVELGEHLYNGKLRLEDEDIDVSDVKDGDMIGLEKNGVAAQYVFLTGIDGKYSPITSRNADANIIHMDGAMETVTVNVAKSAPIVGGAAEEGGDWTTGRNASQINTWCIYSVNSASVYTLKEVGSAFPAKGTKVAQAKQDAGDGTGEVEINKKNVTLADAGTGKVNGNDDAVYLNVSLKAVKTTGVADKDWFQVVDDVDSRTVGAKNASLKVPGLANGTTPNDGSAKALATYPTEEIYTLYKNQRRGHRRG